MSARSILIFIGLILFLGCSSTNVPHSTETETAEKMVEKSGVLSNDEVWSGIIRVSGELIIPRNTTVSVTPGTIVRFRSKDGVLGRIVVRGSLYAQGDSEKPVVFNSAASVPRPGQWDGIFFTSQRMSSELRNCIVQHYRQLYIATDSVRLIDCVLNYVLEAGVVVDRASPKLVNLNISQCENGIYCTNGATCEISQSNIMMNGYGIVCESGSSPEISNCVISNNRMHGVVCYSGSSPVLDSNNVVHNGGWAVYGGGRLINNFIMGNNKRPPNEVELETSPSGKQYQQVEEISSMRASPVPYAGIRR